MEDATVAAPTVSQVAVIWNEDAGSTDFRERDIIVQTMTVIAKKSDTTMDCMTHYNIHYSFHTENQVGTKESKNYSQTKGVNAQQHKGVFHSTTAEDLLNNEAED